MTHLPAKITGFLIPEGEIIPNGNGQFTLFIAADIADVPLLRIIQQELAPCMRRPEPELHATLLYIGSKNAATCNPTELFEQIAVALKKVGDELVAIYGKGPLENLHVIPQVGILSHAIVLHIAESPSYTALKQLTEQLAEELALVVNQQETRAFLPHVTLSRKLKGVTPIISNQILSEESRAALAHAKLTIPSFSLYQSGVDGNHRKIITYFFSSQPTHNRNL